MKQIVILVTMVCTTFFANAQFNTYKKNYDAHGYSFEKGDKYQPVLAGTLALFPGMGHVYAGQPMRGLGFIAGMAGSLFMTGTGFFIAYGGSDVGGAMMIFGALSFVGIYVWNIFDAVHVVKIKNLAYRDGKISASIKPGIFSYSMGNFKQQSVGLSFTVNF